MRVFVAVWCALGNLAGHNFFVATNAPWGSSPLEALHIINLNEW